MAEGGMEQTPLPAQQLFLSDEDVARCRVTDVCGNQLIGACYTCCNNKGQSIISAVPLA